MIELQKLLDTNFIDSGISESDVELFLAYHDQTNDKKLSKMEFLTAV